MSVREEVRDWLARNWDPNLALVEWRGMLCDAGWAVPSWPEEWYGHGLDREESGVVSQEFARAGAVGPATGAGMTLAGPTLLTHASDDVKKRFLRRALTGEDKWCQLFSEPGAGSDLAGLQTRADRHGDEWIVNGQKVWTTGARNAHFALLVARTDWDVPKHRGITYFVLPMKQDGVDVRRIRQMNGFASFNEVFITDARVPAENLVGEVNGGWSVAMTTLAFERSGIAGLRVPGVPRHRGDGPAPRALREAAEEAAEIAQTYAWYRSRAGRPDQVVEVARLTGRTQDPIARQDIARIYSLERISQWNAMRARAAAERGLKAGPEGSLGKLSGTRIARVASRVHASLAGAAAMLAGDGAIFDGIVAEIVVSVPGGSIAGGTDEIQRNILGERVLGLPKEPSVDVDIPFREVRRNPTRGA